MRLEQLLIQSVRHWPDKTALAVGSARLTYAELDRLTDRLVAALRDRGVSDGDRVVICLPNSIEAVAAVFAVLKARAVFCLVHPSTKAGKLAYILNHCEVKAVITSERLLPVVAEACEQAPSVLSTIVTEASDVSWLPGAEAWDAVLADTPWEVPTASATDLDLATLIYTSGSTGMPKGVMHTHQSLAAVTASICDYLGNTSSDIILSVLPLSFGYGLTQVFTGFQVGATVILEPSFTFPVAVLQKIARERVTGFPLVPTMAALIVQMKQLPAGDYSSLRYFTNAAAALPPAHIERLRELFPQARLYSMYGMTECIRTTYLPLEQLTIRPSSVGKAIPNTEVYIVNELGERVGPDEVGELVVRGPHVMRGYWRNSKATRRMLRRGRYAWEKVLHTGDLFRMDTEGYLYFVSRQDDIIKVRGEKVSPKEIENVLYMLPEVREAAVVGVPDPILGNTLKAVIVLADQVMLSERDVLAHCSRHLEDFMVPKQVEFLAELPKTDSGKIRCAAVQAEAASCL